ncbi:signal recognition particle-docking protein FtsY [Nostoc sp. LEGE 06077]|uniref:signal recognition particle-docking protein FtsY n=1 Tax=Nostoc sp. LEGE 06077 TaxID=915325 RepID=UPI00187E759B|nr:signal recognition particle-docking protein FtsY [Nostoc sp. LEGE 06077]MBE9208488.1 signal recognition particle-docking protein FtsY [Nostoc sp. LEGE 06077]
MAFNWFRRQYNDSSDTPSENQQAENTPAPVTQPEATETSDTNPTTAPESAADLLAFAKAAYKNIQQKQQSETEEPAPTPSATPETIAAVTEEVATPSPEPVAIIETETTVEEVPATEVETTEPTSTETAALSFLERAAAERQAKQERFLASAIEVPEPELAQPATISGENVAEIPDLVFDEGFVWSAELLAAQGRRAEDISIEEITWLKKLRQGLDKTRRNILNQLKAIVGQGPLNQAAVTEIESVLLQADVGVEATDYIISALQKKLREEVTPPEEAIAYLKQLLRDMLDEPIRKSDKPSFAPEKDHLNIWLITGVNGAGKTTTIGKIAHLAQKSGYRCLIGAADTFRAAAVEQVKVWGTRSGVEVIANPGKNTDPAAVVFDAIAAAQARETELLLVDTAGRLQNKKNLMDELSKVRRIIDKKAPNAKIESLLVLDATLGQNGLRQAEVFSQAAQLSGVVLTKLDGTAKGGVALAVVQQLGLPIRFIGAGEGIEDLRPFSSYEFVEALLSG